MATQSLQPATANELNQGFVALAMKHTQPKDMSETERDCHIAIRNLFRTFVQGSGSEEPDLLHPKQPDYNHICAIINGRIADAWRRRRGVFPILKDEHA